MKYVESVQCLQQGADFGKQRKPQQPQDEKNFQSECAESEDRERRKDRIRLRLRALPQERQSGTRLIEFRELESLPYRGGFLRFFVHNKLDMPLLLFSCQFAIMNKNYYLRG